jgi:hypothetical protein
LLHGVSFVDKLLAFQTSFSSVDHPNVAIVQDIIVSLLVIFVSLISFGHDLIPYFQLSSFLAAVSTKIYHASKTTYFLSAHKHST